MLIFLIISQINGIFGETVSKQFVFDVYLGDILVLPVNL